MANLSITERRQLEELFQMGGGYVLDFSNRTLQEFVEDSVGVDIYDDRYHYGSGSKANRLRGFWKVESDALAAKLISDLIDYAEFVNKEAPGDLVNRGRHVVRRLRGHAGSIAAPTVAAQPPTVAEDLPPTSKQHVRAFISYSWDSEDHKDWVRELADSLASSGVDIILDQYDLRPGQDRFQFMESSVRDADVVLCVCTPLYVSKANSRKSGVGIETGLITPKFFEEARTGKRFIPILRRTAEGTPPVPDYLAPLIYVDFQSNSDFGRSLEDLLREIHNQPRLKKPPLGPIPKFD